MHMDLSALPDSVLEAVLARVCRHSPRHAAQVAQVSRAWRDAAAAASSHLAAGLRSDAGASSLAAHLRRHAPRLVSLEVSTLGLFSRHIDTPAKAALFAALLQSAGLALPPAVAAALGEQQPAAVAGAQQPPRQQQLRLASLRASMRLGPAECEALGALAAVAPELLSLQLVGSRTRRLALPGVQALATQLVQLTSLQLESLGIGDEACCLLVQHLRRLRALSLAGNNLGPVGAAAIAQHQSQLSRLDLSVNRVKDAGLVALCSSLSAACLASLSLAGNIALGATALQQLQCMSALTGLRLSTCGLDGRGLAAVAAALPQLQALDCASNKLHKLEALSGFVCLTSLNVSRNGLQMGAAKVLAGLPGLRELVCMEALPAKAGAQLGSESLSSLLLGADPSLHGEGSEGGLALAKPRSAGSLLGPMLAGGQLRVLALPCVGLGDAGCRALAALRGLASLNLAYNRVTTEGLAVLAAGLATSLACLELRGMRPELGDEAVPVLNRLARLASLDLAYNDLGPGVRELGAAGGLGSALASLVLRSNVQVERGAVLAAAPRLPALTSLNLLEVSDCARGQAQLWAAFPNLTELVCSSSAASQGGAGRVLLAGGGGVA